MTNGHLHLRRFVAPARMISHRLHSSRFIVRGKRGANFKIGHRWPRASCGFSTPALIQGWLRAPKLADLPTADERIVWAAAIGEQGRLTVP
jgi:hypothetical protein